MSQFNVGININGWDTTLQVNSLILQQAYNRHHSFELKVYIPVGYKLSIESVKAILGEQAIITISNIDKEGEACKFIGFVDEATPIWNNRNTTLKIKGFSPTFFMDCSPRFRCFTNQSIGQILYKVMSGYSGSHRASLNSSSTGDQVSFTMQSQETDYKYLCRLADNFGKLFFYDGEKLNFSGLNDSESKAIALDFTADIQHLEMSMNIAPLRFKITGYNLEKSELTLFNSNGEFSNTNEAVKATISKSSSYPTGTVHLNHLVNGVSDLKAAAKKITAQQAHELVAIEVISNHCGLKIGSKISIEGTDEIVGNGTFIITEIIHRVNSNNSYSNSFTAVPSGYPFPIRMLKGRGPVSGPMQAIVKDNRDLQNLGRVRVKFIGDEENSISPWLRVLAPYTGNGGTFFLPENGDHVIVFHENFDSEKLPFVMGAFYHGKSKADKWSDSSNKKKGFSTEKINFLFDDNSGKLTIEAEEIEFIAKKEMSLDGGRQMTHKATRIDLNP